MGHLGSRVHVGENFPRMEKHGCLHKRIQHIHPQHQPVVTGIGQNLIPSKLQKISIGTVCHKEFHLLPLLTSAVNQSHGSAQGNPVKTDFHGRVLRPEEIHPAIHIIYIMNPPIRLSPAALPVAAEIYEKNIVSHILVHRNVGHTHGTILVKTMKKDNRLLSSLHSLNISAPKLRPILRRHHHPLPAIPLLQPMHPSQIQPMILNPQNPVPGRRKKLLISKITSIKAKN